MIEINSLSKRFGSVWALKDTQWTVTNKKALGLLGPNGAGKSTTMKILTGILRPTEGSVTVDGQDIQKHPIEVKSKMGFLPETPPLYDEMKVIPYLNFVAGLKGVPSNERKPGVDRVIEKLSLESVTGKFVGQLSKGFRQRLGIAQALVNDPPIVILDEPSIGLDPQQVAELRQLILSLKADHTIILSTHVLSEVQQICDDVVIIDKGKILSKGSIQDTLNRMQNRHGIKLKLGTLKADFMEQLHQMPQVDFVRPLENNCEVEIFSKAPIDKLDPYMKLALEHRCGILEVEKYQTQLEDAYIQITQKELEP